MRAHFVRKSRADLANRLASLRECIRKSANALTSILALARERARDVHIMFLKQLGFERLALRRMDNKAFVRKRMSARSNLSP
jgi:hypothetical protein